MTERLEVGDRVRIRDHPTGPGSPRPEQGLVDQLIGAGDIARVNWDGSSPTSAFPIDELERVKLDGSDPDTSRPG